MKPSASPLLPFLLLLAHAQPAAAQSDFYRGKTLSVVVGSSAGGAYDLYGRLLARHIGRHIQGSPTAIVQNMPGAGSLTAVRYLDAGAAKDGTVLVTFNPGLITQSITEPETMKMKYTDVAWIGGITHEFRMCYAWHATGLKSWQDVLASDHFALGVTAPGTSAYVNGAILRNLLGVKLQLILGYPGSAELRLATERGELDGGCSEWNAMPEDWIRDRKINVFVRWQQETPADFPPGVPFIGDLAKSQEDKSVLALIEAPAQLGNPFAVSRQVPPDRIATLRAAFAAMLKDPAFLADAAATKMPIGPTSGAEAEKRVAEIYAAVTPAVIVGTKEAMK